MHSNFIISTLATSSINYKVLLLTYKALIDLAPVYLTDLYNDLGYNPSCSSRSQN